MEVALKKGNCHATTPNLRIDQILCLHSRGPKDLKNDTGLVHFFKDFEVTPLLPHPPKMDMSDPKRQFWEKNTLK